LQKVEFMRGEMNLKAPEMGLERRAGIIAMMVCICLMLLVVIVPGTVSAADELLGMDTTSFGLGVVVLAAAVIVVLYLMYGKKEEITMATPVAEVKEALPDVEPVADENGKCARCGKKMLPSWKTCPECTMGEHKLNYGAAACTNCGEYTMAHWVRCPTCGTALKH
jgi:uncharacterized integral membrane protein/DNA-directed RNA polymerase subunit RPC12/RpoP